MSARLGSWVPFPWARFLKFILPALASAGLVRTVHALDSRHSLRTRVMWQEGERRGVRLTEVRPFGRGIDAFIAEQNGRVFGFEGLPRPAGYHRALEWMDDKVEMRRRFEDAGIPIAGGGVASSVREAKEIFSAVGPPLIVKPRIGSRSRHTHMGIRSEERLLRAFVSARRLCPSVVIERELQGAVHRVTLVGGRVVAVARRDVPHVMGDGKNTVRELVEIKNTDPRRNELPQRITSPPPSPSKERESLRERTASNPSPLRERAQGEGQLKHAVFHPIEINEELVAILRRQCLSLDTILPVGTRVKLGVKVNRGTGGEVVELTPQVHEENLKMFTRIGEAVGDPLVGVDIVMTAVDIPWHAQECGVIECNSLPFIELHHFPYEGEPVNVAGAVWDLVVRDFL